MSRAIEQTNKFLAVSGVCTSVIALLCYLQRLFPHGFFPSTCAGFHLFILCLFLLFVQHSLFSTVTHLFDCFPYFCPGVECVSESKAFGLPFTEQRRAHDGMDIARNKTSAGCGSTQLFLTAQCWDLCSKGIQEKVRHQIKVWDRKLFLSHAFPRGVCMYIHYI